MPGPSNKRKTKATSNQKAKGDLAENAHRVQATSLPQCLTLEEDEITRCGQLATEGYPKPERCKVHHGQYRILYKKYKEASKVVDNIKDGAEVPSIEQASRFTDWHAALKKARWVRTYLEAIRVERTGRDIHQKRFFLKADDGHKRRIKLLEREMVRAVDALDALQKRACELYQPDSTLHAIRDNAPSAAEIQLERKSKRTTKEVVESICNAGASRGSIMPILGKKDSMQPPILTMGDEDLIDVSLRAQKETMIAVFKPFIDLESYMEVYLAEDHPKPETEHNRVIVEKNFFIYQQFARRIIFHEPTLFMKSLEKVSFKDLILSDNFSFEDILRFIDLFLSPLGFPLKWFKDAVLDALAMSRHGTAANVGSLESRVPMLGGWIFNRSHTTNISNEAWWFLLKLLHPPPDIENRFVRLCNNFDDLLGFLEFEALGLVPSPSFCKSSLYSTFDDPALSRNHLSLCGVVVADVVASPKPPHLCGPIPSTRRPARRGYIVWAEIETRGYMFGAMRNEPDPFVEAFLRELRARPDLFQVVLHSETTPERQIEVFGSGPSNDDALPAMRGRNFEAPPSPTCPTVPASTPSDKWEVARSAVDVLYGTQKEIQGYLTILARDNPRGWFFRFKTFPVRYFVILDTVPNRDGAVLARNVAWAALRAKGYAEGEYTLRKYAVAADALFERCAQERLRWVPSEEWSVGRRMQDLLYT